MGLKRGEKVKIGERELEPDFNFKFEGIQAPANKHQLEAIRDLKHLPRSVLPPGEHNRNL